MIKGFTAATGLITACSVSKDLLGIHVSKSPFLHTLLSRIFSQVSEASLTTSVASMGAILCLLGLENLAKYLSGDRCQGHGQGRGQGHRQKSPSLLEHSDDKGFINNHSHGHNDDGDGEDRDTGNKEMKRKSSNFSALEISGDSSSVLQDQTDLSALQPAGKLLERIFLMLSPLLWFLAIGILLGAGNCNFMPRTQTGVSPTHELSGTGATLPGTLYQRYAEQFSCLHADEVKVRYAMTGSGAGQKALLSSMQNPSSSESRTKR